MSNNGGNNEKENAGLVQHLQELGGG